MFRRRKKWHRMAGKLMAGAAENPAVRTGAAALAGMTAVTAASAAASSARRRSQS
jgi:hypothetical protein